MERRRTTAAYGTKISTKVMDTGQGGRALPGETPIPTQITVSDYGFQYFSAQQYHKYLEIFRPPGPKNQLLP
jgi:hypothetical protein